MDKEKIKVVKDLAHAAQAALEDLDEKAQALIADFVARHGDGGEVDVEDFFLDHETEEPAEGGIIVMNEDEDEDYAALYGEPLTTITVRRDPAGHPVALLNGRAALTAWYNRPLVTAIVDMLEQIDRDVEEGRACFRHHPIKGELIYL